jgi:hypothetical protein
MFTFLKIRMMKKVLALLILFLAIYSSGQNGLIKTLENHVHYLASEKLEGRGLGTEGKEMAKSYIAEQFKQAGIQQFNGSFLQEFDVRIDLAWIKASNVIGYVEGTDSELKNEYILIGGHYDHLGYELEGENKTIFSGADDNASGTAGVIELARYFSQPKNKTKRSLIFVCFDAEESGLFGSSHIAKNPPVPIDKIKLMLSLDMIGMLDAYGGVDLKGISLIAGAKEIFEREGNQLGVRIKNTSGTIEQQTDTAPFAEQGVPSVHVFTGLKSPYHKPEDKPNLLDFQGMVKVLSLLQNGISTLGNQPEIKLAKHVDAIKIKSGGKKSFLSTSVVMHNGLGHHRLLDENFVAKRRYNIAMGLHFQIRIAQNFRLVSEVLGDYNRSASLNGNVDRLSTTFPLMIQFATSDASSDDFRAFLNLGTFYRRHFYARQGGATLAFSNGFESQEFGFSGSVGIQARDFQFFYTFRRSLSPNRLDDKRFQDVNNLIGVSYKLF